MLSFIGIWQCEHFFCCCWMLCASNRRSRRTKTQVRETTKAMIERNQAKFKIQRGRILCTTNSKKNIGTRPFFLALGESNSKNRARFSVRFQSVDQMAAVSFECFCGTIDVHPLPCCSHCPEMCCKQCFIKLVEDAKQIIEFKDGVLSVEIAGIVCPECTRVQSVKDLENRTRVEVYCKFDNFFVSECPTCGESFKNHFLASHLLNPACIRFTCAYCDRRDCRPSHYLECQYLCCFVCETERTFSFSELKRHMLTHEKRRKNVETIRACAKMLEKHVFHREDELIDEIATGCADLLSFRTDE